MTAIVEEKDTTLDQRQLKEVNTGIIAIKEKLLRKYITLIKNNNVKKEYYLTDIIKILIDEGHKVVTHKFPLLIGKFCARCKRCLSSTQYAPHDAPSPTAREVNA